MCEVFRINTLRISVMWIQKNDLLSIWVTLGRLKEVIIWRRASKEDSNVGESGKSQEC